MAADNIYFVGALVRCSSEFTDLLGVFQDPSNVFCIIRIPAGTQTTYHYGVDAALVKDSVGHYHLDVDASTVGQHVYRFYSTGTGQTAMEGRFNVTSYLP